MILKKKNEEIFRLIFKSDKRNVNRIKKNIGAIDHLSQQIKLVLRYVDSNKEEMDGKFSEYVHKIMNWLDSMHDIYDGMETEMDSIIIKLKSLKVFDRVEALTLKVRKIVDKIGHMKDVTFDLHENSDTIVKFMEQVGQLKFNFENSKREISRQLNQKGSESAKASKFSRNFVSVVLFLICIMITYVSYKVNKIVMKRTSRLL